LQVTKGVVKALVGNHAVAYAVKQAKPQVLAVYPITPQTTMLEKLSEYVDRGSRRNKGSCNIITMNEITGGEVVVEGYGPGDPPGGVTLPELSRRELKDSARFDLRRGLPGGEEVGESHGWGRTRRGRGGGPARPSPSCFV